MKNTFNNSSRTTFLIRQKSLSSLPSRQFSISDFYTQRQNTLQVQKKKHLQESLQLASKQEEISKLKRNLQTAVSTAINERLSHNKVKESQINQHYERNNYQQKIQNLQKQINSNKEQFLKMKGQNQQMTSTIKQQQTDIQTYSNAINSKEQVIKQLTLQLQQINHLQLVITDIQPLKQRIIILEEDIRAEKLKCNAINKQIKEAELEKQKLLQQLALIKPKEQELQSKIAYFQRVNLDLTRKMEDFNRRENQYIKQINHLRINLQKITNQKLKFKSLYEATDMSLTQKTIDCENLTEELTKRVLLIQNLEFRLENQYEAVAASKQQLRQMKEFYKAQGEENMIVTQRNRILQGQQAQLRRTIEHYIKVSEEVSLTIISRTEEIHRLKNSIDTLKEQVQVGENKFIKFDKLMEDGTEKSSTQIRESFYLHIRQNNQLELKVREMKAEFDQKLLVFGEQRDHFTRNVQIFHFPPPTDQTLYQAIFYQKTQSILLLEKSNQHLLKIKKDLEEQIYLLERSVQQQKKQAYILKLKAADLFRAKKQLEEVRKSMQRYLEMIEQSKETISDLQSQLTVLRSKMAEFADKNFTLDLQNKNLELKILEKDSIMKELDVEVLEAKKIQNQKNMHLLNDSLQKLESGIKSLSFFFNCSFCHDTPITPVTVSPCGHTYCAKCKEAFQQSCYQCDTGMPIDKVFPNKYLKEAAGKYKFLTMVICQLNNNFEKIKK